MGVYWDNGKENGNYQIRFRVSLILECTVYSNV